MLNAEKGEIKKSDGQHLKIAVVQSRFNESVTNALWQACHQELLHCAVPEDQIKHYTVAGALEIPVMLKKLAEQGEYDALIALGCIIRGETYHFELVSNESSSGVTRVALDFGIPVINAILTTENLEQAIARQVGKGTDAAQIAVEMANLLKSL